MFTGIVAALGTVNELFTDGDSRRFVIQGGDLFADLMIGDSIAVNGVCLTAVEISGGTATVEVVPETLARSTIGSLAAADRVNLERPLRSDGRFDGHIVQGHVDCVAEVVAVTPEGDGRRMTIALPDDLARYVVEKGSITVDGVSLTVAGLTPSGFAVAVIPHTLEITTLGLRRPGDQVNLEFDVIGKYVERMLEGRS
jgi:riboflavin synthase